MIEEAWRQQLLDALLAGELQDAWSVKDSHIPARLYKYCRFDPAGRALDNLRNGVVHLRQPKHYNDPFDSIQCVRSPQEPRVEGVANALEMAIGEATDPHFRQVLEGPLKDSLRRVFQEGLLASCFSTRSDSLAMWGHYTDCHKGFCVEYPVGQLPADDLARKYLYPVFYTNKRVELPPRFDVRVLTQDVLAAIHKSTDWSYEQEWRIVLPHNDSGDVLTMPTPSGLYLGCKIEELDRGHLERVAEDLGIPIKLMQLSEDDYAIVPTDP